ncbi:MAG: hypothetical protein AB1553_02085 [Nitrospirota bacterium]
MPNAKKITLDYNETGKTVYAIVRRETDSYRLNDADGSFAEAPADPYLALAEDSVIKGRYEVSESRAAWNDGKYTVAIYKQTGGSPAPASDTLIGSGEIYIISDTEIDLQYLHDKVLELRTGNMRILFTVATVPVPARNVEVGRINYQTIQIKRDADVDWASPVSSKTLYFWYDAMGDINPSKVGESG